MQVEELLSRLRKVRGKSPQWTACCPAHEDKSPSLAIGINDGHQILMHCFAGCGIDDICAAIGVELHELYPPDQWLNNRKGTPEWVEPLNVLHAIERELYSLAVAAGDVTANRPQSEKDIARRKLAQARIIDASRYARRPD